MPSSILGSIASSVAGPLISGLFSSNASSDAADAQSQASGNATAAQLQMYNQSRADLAPYRAAGTAANNQLSYLLGLTVPTSSSNQGFTNTSSGGTGASGNLPGNVVSALKSFTSKSPNYQYPDGSDLFVNHVAAQAAAMSPTDYQAWLKQFGLPSNTDQSIFSGAINGTSPTTTTTNNGYGDTVNTATGAYGSLLKPFALSDFQTDPGYQFRLDQGNKAIQAKQAQTGNFYSGAALKEADAYNSGQAAQQYNTAYDQYNTNNNNIYSRLTGVSNAGRGANSEAVQSNQSNANALGSIYASQGQNAYNSAINQGNIYSQALTGLLSGASSYGGGSNIYNGGASGLIPYASTDLGSSMPWLNY